MDFGSQIHKIKSNYLNNTATSNDEILFFNRVPKTGSVQMIALMRDLAKVHNYEVQLDPQNGGIVPILSELEQENMVDNIENLEADTVFVSHVNYLNFSEFGADQPIYVNLVRDPVERVISWYYYIRAPWIFVPNRRRSNRQMPNPLWVNSEFVDCVKSAERTCSYIEGAGLERVGDHRRQTLFFCGHNEKTCMPFNSKTALEGAKQVVERSYAVVGTWEDTNITLAVLEAYIPKYFMGASRIYYSKLSDTKQNSNPMKPQISEEIKNLVRKNFTREIEFYQFCRQRLHKQYIALQLEKINSYKLH